MGQDLLSRRWAVLAHLPLGDNLSDPFLSTTSQSSQRVEISADVAADIPLPVQGIHPKPQKGSPMKDW